MNSSTSLFHTIDLLRFIDQGYLQIPDALPTALATRLHANIQHLKQTEQLRSAQIGRGVKKKLASQVRGDSILWLDQLAQQHGLPDLEAIQQFQSLIEELRESLKQALRLSINSSEFHFAHYPPNSGYDRHVDQHHSGQRLLSLVYYLNPDWQPDHGGQLQMFVDPDKSVIEFAPLFNSLMLFRSDIEHKVCATSHPRNSIVGWFRREVAHK